MKSVIEKYKEEREEMYEKMAKREHLFNSICAAIPDEWNVDGGLDSSCCFDIRFTGDKARLQEMWKVLRTAGLTPDEHVGVDVVSSFSTFWRQDGEYLVYMSWSSSVCKMKVVRMETREYPVYETVCNDTSAADVPVLSAE